MVSINTMPGLEDRLPVQTSKHLQQREMRARQVMRYVQTVEMGKIALRLRREGRAWEKLHDSCVALGPAGVENAAIAAKALAGIRSTLFEIAGLPKRPGRIPDDVVKIAREAVAEEITIEQPPQTSDETSN